MRISDWSSDVCSSDLDGRAKIGSHAMRLVLAALLTVSAIPVLAQDIPTEAPGAPDPSRVVAGTYNVDSDHTRSEEHTSELQSLMRISYAVFCLKKKKNYQTTRKKTSIHNI